MLATCQRTSVPCVSGHMFYCNVRPVFYEEMNGDGDSCAGCCRWQIVRKPAGLSSGSAPSHAVSPIRSSMLAASRCVKVSVCSAYDSLTVCLSVTVSVFLSFKMLYVT